MQILRYAGPFAFLAAVPLLFRISDAAPLIVPAAVLISLLIAHHVPNGLTTDPSPFFRFLPIVYIPLQLAAIIGAAQTAARPDTTSAAFVSLAVSVGVCAGVFGVLAAHEMIHSRTRWHRWLGSALLTGITYRHFRIAHVYGHHRFAATKRDASTARMGESYYAFLARTLPAQWREAWRFEERRWRSRSLPFLRNALVQDFAIMLAIYPLLFFSFGRRAAAFLAVESAVAILVLEAFNYVAHYGLMRRKHRGGPEPMAEHHSWNSGGADNFLIFNMGRHSHHHSAPSIGYESLEPVSRAPTLPGGYAGALLLALVPPLWRMIMDQRVLAVRGERESHYAQERKPAAAIP
jgi:alkane 1-monooxygenase